jgi:hypothetical protein
MTAWLLVALTSLVVAGAGFKLFGRGASANRISTEATPDRPSHGGVMGRDQIAQKLKELAAKTPPRAERRGAMCYRMAMPEPEQVKYICPVDGTVVTFPASQARIAEDANSIRAALPDLRQRGLDVTLDESDLCPKCRGSRKVEAPKLALIVRYPKDAQPHRVEGVSPVDVTLLREFLEGDGIHKLNGPDTAPLRDLLPRLRELLGVPVASGLTRDELTRRLGALPDHSDKPLNMGAMCYSMALPPQINEYVCPTDGHKTVYRKGQQAGLLSGALSSMRSTVERIKEAHFGIEVSLDESELCRRCKPNVKEPQVVLIVRRSDGTEQRTRAPSPEDLELLFAFLSGQTTITGSTGTETLLKSYDKRLRVLLGL